MLDNLIFISAQPVDIFFLWQVEVQIVNFRKFGISDKMEILVWYPKNRAEDLKPWLKLNAKYPEVNIYAYQDQGVNLRLYISQLRPHILKMHFAQYKARLKDKVFFYHDSDILFRELPNFEKLLKDDICWQSNCSHYLDYNYLRRKEIAGKLPRHKAIDALAKIGGITAQTIEDYSGKTGGAQVILKGIDNEFWKDVEEMCMKIRYQFAHVKENGVNPKSINSLYFQETRGKNRKIIKTGEQNGFQSWCADMWALNFALWKRGIKTDVTPELDFSWASDDKKKYLAKPIFHNAGAGANSGLFYKGEWRLDTPIGKDIPDPPEDTASWYYVQAIKDVK